MAKYVPDSSSKRWVIIVPSRTKRPDDHPTIAQKPSEYPVCPFCPGNEKTTPPELYRIGNGGADTPGWSVRVVPNKFPITDVHEVIIHSPSCTDDVDALPVPQVADVMTAYRDRYRSHESDGQVLIFCNHGFSAGASLKHPHSQLVVVPNQINLDAVSRGPIQNVVKEDSYFVTYCPDFSQWPLEVWIAPIDEGNKFSDLRDTELPALASVLQDALKRITIVVKDPTLKLKQKNEPFVFNYYIYHGVNWFLRIIPRAVYRAGFELGTGLSVNVVDPKDAAKLLQEVKI